VYFLSNYSSPNRFARSRGNFLRIWIKSKFNVSKCIKVYLRKYYDDLSLVVQYSSLKTKVRFSTGSTSSSLPNKSPLMKYARYIIAIALLCWIQNCFGNNSDPCLNPANLNQVQWWRQDFAKRAQFNLFYSTRALDSTGCYFLDISSYEVYQHESSKFFIVQSGLELEITTATTGLRPGYSRVTFYGSVRENCASPSHTHELNIRDYVVPTMLLNFDSPLLQTVNISPIQAQGTLPYTCIKATNDLVESYICKRNFFSLS